MAEKHQAHGLEEAERRAELKLLRRKKMRCWFYRALVLSSVASLIVIATLIVRSIWFM